MKVYKATDWLGWTGVHDIANTSKDYDVVINVGMPQGVHIPGKICRNNFFHDQPGMFPYRVMYDLACQMEEYRKEGKRVLVNCHEGNSRSVSLVLCWLTLFGGYDTVLKAFDEVIFKEKPWVTYDGNEIGEPQPLRFWFAEDWPVWIEKHRSKSK